MKRKLTKAIIVSCSLFLFSCGENTGNTPNGEKLKTISNPQNCEEIIAILSCAEGKYDGSEKSKITAAIQAINTTQKIGVRTEAACKGSYDGVLKDFEKGNYDNSHLMSCTPESDSSDDTSSNNSDNSSDNNSDSTSSAGSTFKFVEQVRKPGSTTQYNMHFQYSYDVSKLPENSYLFKAIINHINTDGEKTKFGWNSHGTSNQFKIDVKIGSKTIKGESSQEQIEAGLKGNVTFDFIGSKYAPELAGKGNTYELELIFRQDGKGEESEVSVTDKVTL